MKFKNKFFVTNPLKHYFSFQARRYSSKHPILEAFNFLAECNFEKGCEIGQAEWTRQDYVFPFSDDDSEVSLFDYYGDLHYNLVQRKPKIMLHRRSHTEDNVIRAKIDTLLRSMCEKASPDSLCRLEIDFVKLLLFCPPHWENSNENVLTVTDIQRGIREQNFEERLQISMVRTHLPSGPDSLVSVLENLGAKLKKKEDRKHTLRCVCFKKNFQFKNRSFESSLFVDPENLVFCEWQSIMFPSGSMCLVNPGTGDDVHDDDFICDLRIKAKTKEVTVTSADDFRDDRWKLKGRIPLALTQPGLNHQFRRNSSDNGFRFEPNAHILELQEKFNKVYRYFDLDGFTVVLSTTAGREFKVEKSGKNELRYSYECWPKLLFYVEDKERIPELVDLTYRCITTFFDALTKHQLEMSPWQCYGYQGVATSSLKAQVLRRISENETLEGMLGINEEENPHIISDRLSEILKELDQMTFVSELDPIDLKRKLVVAAQERGIEAK